MMSVHNHRLHGSLASCRVLSDDALPFHDDLLSLLMVRDNDLLPHLMLRSDHLELHLWLVVLRYHRLTLDPHLLTKTIGGLRRGCRKPCDKTGQDGQNQRLHTHSSVRRYET